MVKALLVFLVSFIYLNAEINPHKVNTNYILEDTPVEYIEEYSTLEEKIKSFIGENSFRENKEFIKLIFSPNSDYYMQDRVDVVKLVETLKENGLLKLFFKQPQELHLSFKTSGSALLFVKILGDTLRNIGYYRYVTSESQLDASQFRWTISLIAEYATDPLILEKELAKSGCKIADIVKNSSNDWEYIVDMSQARLNVPVLASEKPLKLKRSLYAHWLNIEEVKKLSIKSSFKDDWYPHISYYDQQLHLLELMKKDKKTRNITLNLPKGAKYIKISDMYTLKNVKDNLILTPHGSR